MDLSWNEAGLKIKTPRPKMGHCKYVLSPKRSKTARLGIVYAGSASLNFLVWEMKKSTFNSVRYTCSGIQPPDITCHKQLMIKIWALKFPLRDAWQKIVSSLKQGNYELRALYKLSWVGGMVFKNKFEFNLWLKIKLVPLLMAHYVAHTFYLGLICSNKNEGDPVRK